MEIVIAQATLDLMRRELESTEEQGAAIYLEHDRSGDRYLIRSWEVAEDVDIEASSSVEITFSPAFLTRTTRRAVRNNQFFGLLHTHPEGYRNFSKRDDVTEAGIAPFMTARMGTDPVFAMVLCEGGLIARQLGKLDPTNVRVVGRTVTLHGAARDLYAKFEIYDRQVRAFGIDGQRVLSKLTVSIVGLGGTGSVMAQQLAHLGVGEFLLFDPDVVEETNLNRVVGATSASINEPKVDVARRNIQSINPAAKVITHQVSVVNESSRDVLCRSHLILICTDSHSSRAFLSELAYQYLIPAIDVGVAIGVDSGKVTSITGRTQMLSPGLPCLLCSNCLSPGRIREELMSDAQRAADPYFSGPAVRQPAVISLNSTVVSLAVTMFLGIFTEIPSVNRWFHYDGVTGSVRPLMGASDPDCHVCGTESIAGSGDSRILSFL